MMRDEKTKKGVYVGSKETILWQAIKHLQMERKLEEVRSSLSTDINDYCLSVMRTKKLALLNYSDSVKKVLETIDDALINLYQIDPFKIQKESEESNDNWFSNSEQDLYDDVNEMAYWNNPILEEPDIPDWDEEDTPIPF